MLNRYHLARIQEGKYRDCSQGLAKSLERITDHLDKTLFPRQLASTKKVARAFDPDQLGDKRDPHKGSKPMAERAYWMRYLNVVG